MELHRAQESVCLLVLGNAHSSAQIDRLVVKADSFLLHHHDAAESRADQENGERSPAACAQARHVNHARSATTRVEVHGGEAENAITLEGASRLASRRGEAHHAAATLVFVQATAAVQLLVAMQLLTDFVQLKQLVDLLVKFLDGAAL
eukprot:CAMPEP_0170455202 /NCGR_PEP_ID=MMETSP0123-20130129/3231_1 /TAXON_ID=182087 /ORGANISM="Favella ehrenbergii, Strain Fehren 1" /LENGTH=147 /DNA_ID=CAMNT_0010718233 /DNA_START=161 /DNA_END=604 /DNA_ORIENTATION=-